MGVLRTALRAFLHELKRRHVFRVAAVYASICFVVWQAAAVAFPALNLPHWTLTLVVALALLGLPVALVLAWAYDLTPDGPRRAADAAASAEPHPEGSPPARPRGARRVWPGYAAALALLVLGAGAWLWLRPVEAEAVHRRVAVAVFENRTADPALDPLGSMAADWVVRGIMRSTSVDVLDVGTLYAQGRTETGDPTDPRSLARRNGAALVVAGSYYVSRDTLYFSANVIDVPTGRVLRTLDPVGTPEANPLLAIAEVRERLATALVTTLDPGSSVLSLPHDRPPSFSAYQEFVTGQDVYWRGRFADALPHYRRAAELDSTFTTATIHLAVAAVGIGRCDIADSIAGALEPARNGLLQSDAQLLAITLGRCRADWESNYAVARPRSVAHPGSSNLRWVYAAQARRTRRPAEAAAVLSVIDPQTDLGWMSDRGKVLFWRELVAAQHALGDHRGEVRSAERLARLDAGRLAAAYFAARGLAGAGRAEDALGALRGVDRLAADPAIVVSEIAGQFRPAALGTPGWVLYQVATELLAHDRPAAATTAAEHAVRWSRARAADEAATPEHRFVLAQSLELLGRHEEAAALLSALVAEDSTNVELRGAAGVVAARRGDRDDARAATDWLATVPERHPLGLPVLYRARIAAVLGDDEHALTLLESLPYGWHPVDPLAFHSDPAFSALRNAPRFLALLRNRD